MLLLLYVYWEMFWFFLGKGFVGDSVAGTADTLLTLHVHFFLAIAGSAW